MVELTYHEDAFGDLDQAILYAILKLRVDVFVVEQTCPYPDLDGRDTEPTARHIWLQDGDDIATYLRLLDDGDVQRIGRVVTADGHRGRGLSRRLITEVLSRHERETVLDAQAHLVQVYERSGFTSAGPEFVEDGIPHRPMRRLV